MHQRLINDMINSMKVILIGLPQAGSQPLFSLLTGVPEEQVLQKPLEALQGICEVRDPRIVKLKELFNPKKTTFARIEYTLLPDLATSGPAKTLIFNELKNADELCFIVTEEQALEELNQFFSELIIADFMLVEKRLETIARDQRKKFQETREKEKLLMEKIKATLDNSQPLAPANFNEEELKTLRAYQFLTLKPCFVSLNLSGDKLANPELMEKIAATYHLPAVALNIKLESELLALPAADRQEYMKEIGLTEPAIDRMTQMVFTGLGLFSFFTVGEDEVRAWPVRRGASAAEAGGVIHSDIEKGFVRAEHMRYEELLALGSEAKVKEAGKFSLKGRDYLVEDGDVLSFRFNV